MNVRGRYKGFAAIWYALVMISIVGLIGLAIDISYSMWVAQQLQSTADAASLAAAQYVQQDVGLARQAALDYGQRNRVTTQSVLLDPNAGNEPNGDVVVGYYDSETGEFVATSDPGVTKLPNAVKVVARKTSGSLNGSTPLFFGQMFGVHSVNVERTAIAVVDNGTGAGLIALNEKNPNSFYVLGSPTVVVEGGAIQVDSQNSSAVRLQGSSAEVVAPQINVVGEVNYVGGATFSGNVKTGAKALGDPLKHLPAPTWNAADDRGEIRIVNGTHVVQPGFYSQGITLRGGNVTLMPGIYILDGTGLNIGGNTNVIGENVMFYITGSGKLDMTGTGDIHVTPPDPLQNNYAQADVFSGVTIFQDRRNVGSARIIGTSGMNLEGTLYFPRNLVGVGGTGDGFGNQLIADMIRVSGTGEITIRYDGRNANLGRRVWLVK